MSSYSYQDLESRLRTVEEKVDFVMRNFQVTKRVHTPMVTPDGKPIIVEKQMTLLDVYREVQTGQTAILPKTEGETSGGTE